MGTYSDTAKKHTERQKHWAAAAKSAPPVAAALFALLSFPNEREREQGITTSPLQYALTPEEENPR